MEGISFFWALGQDHTAHRSNGSWLGSGQGRAPSVLCSLHLVWFLAQGQREFISAKCQEPPGELAVPVAGESLPWMGGPPRMGGGVSSALQSVAAFNSFQAPCP